MNVVQIYGIRSCSRRTSSLLRYGGKTHTSLARYDLFAAIYPVPTNPGQLVDHYEGNLILNQLELVTLALECLHSRKTSLKFQGDVSYALMGLLRIRPKIDQSDSAFQAFAR
jgi:hypothetical protein